MSDVLFDELVQLHTENKEQKKQIQNLERSVEALTQAVLYTQKQRFGTSSEKTPSTEAQLILFKEAEAEFNNKVEQPTVESIEVAKHFLMKIKVNN